MPMISNCRDEISTLISWLMTLTLNYHGANSSENGINLSKDSFRKFFAKSLFLPELCGSFEKRIIKFCKKCICVIYTLLINSFILHKLNSLYICNIYLVNYVM